MQTYREKTIFHNEAAAIKTQIKSDLNIINQILSDNLEQKEELIKKIGNNIISAGGKRIRPILSLLTGYSLGYFNQKLYNLGAAIELIHTATLLHDDVIDESAVRRGNKTANALYENKPAILVGDYIFAKSFEQMVKTDSLAVMDILAKASSEIAKAEIMQLRLLGSNNFESDLYFQVIEGKTATLFSAATHSAAMLATNNNEIIAQKFAKFGFDLGISFQIIDDLIDYTSSSKMLGKKSGQDFYEGKITLPIILLYAEATLKTKNIILKLFSKNQRNAEDFAFVKKLMQEQQTLEKTKEKADNLIDNCFNFIKTEDFIKHKEYFKFALNQAKDRIS